MLYYSLSIKDSLINEDISNSSVDFDNRGVASRNVNQGDGVVTIDLANLGTVKALFIRVSSDKTLTVNINTQAVPVNKILFTELNSLTSLTLECGDEDGAEVDVIVWGVD